MPTRLHILRGPARVEYQGLVLHAVGGVRLQAGLRTPEQHTAEFGVIERWTDDVELTVSFAPLAAWSAPVLTMLFPYGGARPGTSLFAGPDRPLVIHSADGVRLTLRAAALTQMPAIRLAGGRAVFGECQFRALPAAGASRAEPASLYQLDTAPVAAVAPPRAQLVAAPATLAWGAAPPWQPLATVDGVTFEFPLLLREESLDDAGVADLTVLEVEARARFTPAGVDEAAVLAAAAFQGAGAERGASRFADAPDFRARGAAGGPDITLRHATPVDGAQLRWSGGEPRAGELTLAAQRAFGADGAEPLFTVGVAV